MKARRDGRAAEEVGKQSGKRRGGRGEGGGDSLLEEPLWTRLIF